MRTPGFDISVANDNLASSLDDVDFGKAYAEGGKRFVWHKATEAETYEDPQFRAFVERASRTPLKQFAYTFGRPDEDARDDVEKFLRATEPVLGKLPYAPVYDMESRGKNMSAHQVVDFVGAWERFYLAERGCGILLYSYVGFLAELVKDLGGPGSAGAQAIVRYPLAIAHYTDAPEPVVPAPWTRWTFWQWAASMQGGPIGICPGVTGKVDLDWFAGEVEDLEWLSSGRFDPNSVRGDGGVT